MNVLEERLEALARLPVPPPDPVAVLQDRVRRRQRRRRVRWGLAGTGLVALVAVSVVAAGDTADHARSVTAGRPPHASTSVAARPTPVARGNGTTRVAGFPPLPTSLPA